jgi:hypothetical protein
MSPFNEALVMQAGRRAPWNANEVQKTRRASRTGKVDEAQKPRIATSESDDGRISVQGNIPTGDCKILRAEAKPPEKRMYRIFVCSVELR